MSDGFTYIEIKEDSKIIMKFNNKENYILDLTDSMRFGTLTSKKLADIFKDGRNSGMHLEHLLCDMFTNLERSNREQSHFDLIDNEWGTSYEVKTVTKHGTKTSPSNMIGQGRKYNVEDHRRKLKEIDYYMFIDVKESPIFKVIPIISDDRLLFRSIGYKNFYKKIAKI